MASPWVFWLDHTNHRSTKVALILSRIVQKNCTITYKNRTESHIYLVTTTTEKQYAVSLLYTLYIILQIFIIFSNTYVMQFQFCMGTKELFKPDDPGQNIQLLHIKTHTHKLRKKWRNIILFPLVFPASRDTQISSQKERKKKSDVRAGLNIN